MQMALSLLHTPWKNMSADLEGGYGQEEAE